MEGDIDLVSVGPCDGFIEGEIVGDCDGAFNGLKEGDVILKGNSNRFDSTVGGGDDAVGLKLVMTEG